VFIIGAYVDIQLGEFGTTLQHELTQMLQYSISAGYGKKAASEACGRTLFLVDTVSINDGANPDDEDAVYLARSCHRKFVDGLPNSYGVSSSSTGADCHALPKSSCNLDTACEWGATLEQQQQLITRKARQLQQKRRQLQRDQQARHDKPSLLGGSAGSAGSSAGGSRRLAGDSSLGPEDIVFKWYTCDQEDADTTDIISVSFETSTGWSTSGTLFTAAERAESGATLVVGAAGEWPSQVWIKNNGANAWGFWKLEMVTRDTSCIIKEDPLGASGSPYGANGYWLDGDGEAPEEMYLSTCTLPPTLAPTTAGSLPPLDGLSVQGDINVQLTGAAPATGAACADDVGGTLQSMGYSCAIAKTTLGCDADLNTQTSTVAIGTFVKALCPVACDNCAAAAATAVPSSAPTATPTSAPTFSPTFAPTSNATSAGSSHGGKTTGVLSTFEVQAVNLEDAREVATIFDQLNMMEDVQTLFPNIAPLLQQQVEIVMFELDDTVEIKLPTPAPTPPPPSTKGSDKTSWLVLAVVLSMLIGTVLAIIVCFAGKRCCGQWWWTLVTFSNTKKSTVHEGDGAMAFSVGDTVMTRWNHEHDYDHDGRMDEVHDECQSDW
jgi:hypothetical protein